MRTIFIALLIFTGLLSAGAQTPDSLYLMPRPQSVKINDGRFLFTTQFTIGVNGQVSPKMTAAANRFFLQLGKRTGVNFPQEYITASDNKADAQLVIRFGKAVLPQIGMDESYSLSITPANITLTAAT